MDYDSWKLQAPEDEYVCELCGNITKNASGICTTCESENEKLNNYEHIEY